MPNTTEKMLLREFVQESLNEESRETLSKIFVNPFTDVAKTAAHGIEQLANSSKVAFKVFIKGMTPAILGMVNETYAEIFTDAKSRARQIQAKYSDVFKANDAAFASDAKVLAFFVNPQAFAGATALDNTLLASMNRTASDIVDKLSKSILAAGDRTSRAASPEALDRRIRQKFDIFSRQLGKNAAPEDIAMVQSAALTSTKGAIITGLISQLEDIRIESGLDGSSFDKTILNTIRRLSRYEE